MEMVMLAMAPSGPHPAPAPFRISKRFGNMGTIMFKRFGMRNVTVPEWKTSVAGETPPTLLDSETRGWIIWHNSSVDIIYVWEQLTGVPLLQDPKNPRQRYLTRLHSAEAV
jgi:hypothetical protein